jgi:cadmium resistance transport/sequestration family protein
MLQTIATSILAFASTNIDDIFILMLFYSQRRIRAINITIGQYLGIGALVAVALVASYVGGFFDQRYVGLLGLFPIYLAVGQFINLLKGKSDDDGNDETANVQNASGSIAVAGVTIANGADNIGVYVPLFTTMQWSEIIQLIVVFAIMVFIWCSVAQYLAGHPLIAKRLEKSGHVIIPFVLLLLGIFILFESGSFELIPI